MAYMHIVGVVLIAVVLLTGVYFTGPRSNSNQATQPLLSSGQVQTLPINSPTPDNKETMVTIRNKKTGETKQVTQSQVSNYTQVTQQPKAVQPSEKALKLSAYVFVVSNEKQRNDLISQFSNGANDLKEAVKNLALLLDSKPEAIALIEKTIAQDIANKKSISDREAIGEYHQKEYERLKAEFDSIPKVTNNTYTGGTRNTATTQTKSESTQVNPYQDSTEEINNRLKNMLNSPNTYSENIFNSPNTPSLNTYKAPIRYDAIGDTVYGSDGSRYYQVGDSIYKNDGTKYYTVGDSLYGSNGSRYYQVGDSIYKNDGIRYDAVGGTIYGSDGSKATSVGDSIYVQPGY